jgi:geranyl-CoA carboxylase alpha subunit
MEMNTRLQVEHPVTELVYGVDLVQWQFRIALGARLDELDTPMRQQPQGHSIEVRLCAEDPGRHFLPQSGTIGRWVPPDHIRVEHALHDGAFIAPQFDSMIAKLVAHGPDRESARRKLLNALSTLQAFGLATNRDFLIRCLRHPAFESGTFNTGFVAEFNEALLQAPPEDRYALLQVAAALLQSGPSEATGSLLPRLPYPARLELNGERFEGRVERMSPGRFLVAFGHDTADVHILRGACDDTQATINGALLRLRWWLDGERLWIASDHTTLCVRNLSLAAAVVEPSAGAERSQTGDLASPMNARVSQVVVKLGDSVRVGEVLLSLEAMKIEHQIAAPVSGRIARIDVAPGSLVKLGSPLLKIAPEAA